MIEVRNLTKRFGSTVAVDSISFSVPQGQIVGFLGPNGAGKSTTMRMLTGYLPPDDGSAQLLNYELVDHSLEIRKHLGYIPENNPLPEDLETTDYLHLIGRIRGFDGEERMARVKSVLRQCSLQAAVGKKLGELSKGYRQRVGLAQAMIHDPEILIMDEPTSGLDPNQVHEVRDLIQSLKGQKTLLISTHILAEVQQTCDRIIIISKGKIVADGTPAELTGSYQGSQRFAVAIKGPAQQIRERLARLDGVTAVEHGLDEGDAHGFVVFSTVDPREQIFGFASEAHWPIMVLQPLRATLETVFRALTSGTQAKAEVVK